VNEQSKFYVEASRDQAKEFDSRVFWLAGGAIALSAALAQSSAQYGLQGLGWLATGWVALLIAIFVTMISMQVSIAMCSAWIRCLEYELVDQGERAMKLARWLNGLNWTSLGLALFGVALLGEFALLNLGRWVS
jgi:hypothetical protein